jgi:hypothetical protein
MPPGKTHSVTLEQDGKPVRKLLRYDKKAIYQLQARGRSLPELLDRLVRAQDSNAVIDLLWAGLLHQQPNISVMDVVELTPLPVTYEIVAAILRGIGPVFGASEQIDKLLSKLDDVEDPEDPAKKKPSARPKKEESDS